MDPSAIIQDYFTQSMENQRLAAAGVGPVLARAADVIAPEERDVEIRLPGTTTAAIWEVRLPAIHCLCDPIDHRMAGTLP